MKAILSTAVLFAITQSALAQRTSPPEPLQGLDSIAAYIRLVHKPFSEQVAVAPDGRTDRVFDTKMSWDQTLQFYQDAYHTARTLPGNVTCAGWFVVPSKHLATFTLYLGSERFMVVMNDAPDGARLTVWGVNFGSRVPPPFPSRPYHQTVAPEPPVRYGL